MLTRAIARGDIAGASRLISPAPAGASEGGDSSAAPGRLQPVPLVEACPGVEREVRTPSGLLRCYCVRRPVGEVLPDAVAAAREYDRVLRGARQRLDELEAPAALCRIADAGPEDVLFMDTETCGLSGSAVFLVGTMRCAEGGLFFEQFLARHYAEEPAILQEFAGRLEGAGALVTFNGKSFDMSLIRERSAFHRIELPRRGVWHLDLLHECRRRYRGRVPNCRLQTLERAFCGRVRAGDIPSAAIPDAYHRFVSTGDARQMRDILHHNALDLLTMAQLLCAVLTGVEPIEA